jgi:hypothetical protein
MVEQYLSKYIRVSSNARRLTSHDSQIYMRVYIMENVKYLLPAFSGSVYSSFLIVGMVFSLYDFMKDIEPFFIIEIIHLIKLNCTIYKRESHFMGISSSHKYSGF